MARAQDPSPLHVSASDTGVPGPVPPDESGSRAAVPVETHSTRLMLTTAAHFVQQHLNAELAELGLTPLGLPVLSGLAELPHAAVPAVAAQCLLSEDFVRRTLEELEEAGYVGVEDSAYFLTDAGSAALTEARKLEDALFAEKSSTLRLELSGLISRLRDGGVLDRK